MLLLILDHLALPAAGLLTLLVARVQLARDAARRARPA